MQNNYNDTSQYNSDVIKKLKEINKEIENEKNKDTIDGEKLTKLRFAQLLKGLELQCGINF